MAEKNIVWGNTIHGEIGAIRWVDDNIAIATNNVAPKSLTECVGVRHLFISREAQTCQCGKCKRTYPE